MLAKCSPATVLGKPLSEEWLVSFVNCVKEQMSVDGLSVFDGEAQMISKKPGITDCRLRPSFEIYEEVLNVFRAWRTKDCVSRVQGVRAEQAFWGSDMALSTSLCLSGDRMTGMRGRRLENGRRSLRAEREKTKTKSSSFCDT